jgi:type IV secretion system protein VirD4
MHRPDLPLRAGLVLVVVLVTFLLGYRAAYLASHGLDARVWPALRGTPVDWFTPEGSGLRALLAGFVRMAGTYLNMALGRAQALPGGGREAFLLVWGAAIAFGTVILMGGRLVPLRHRLRRFGDAQFASPRALARMRKGIELGLDPALALLAGAPRP